MNEKSCELFRNCMCNETNKKYFFLGISDINEVRKCINYTRDYIFAFFCRCLSELCIDALTGYEKIKR